MRLQRQAWIRDAWSGRLGQAQPSPGSKGWMFLRQSGVEGSHLSGTEVRLTDASPAPSSHPGVGTIPWRGLFSQRLAQSRCLMLRRVIAGGTPVKATLGGFTGRNHHEEETSRNTPGQATKLSLKPADLLAQGPPCLSSPAPEELGMGDWKPSTPGQTKGSLRRWCVGLGAGRREEPGERRWVLRREAKTHG